MVGTSRSAAVRAANSVPAVYLPPKKTGLQKDYYPALPDEGLKPREGQGPPYRSRSRWRLSSSAALEVCREEAGSGLTLTSFQGDLGPQRACLNRLSVASTSQLPHASPAWSTGVGVVVCQPSEPHQQRARSQAGANRAPGLLPPLGSHQETTLHPLHSQENIV